MNTGYPGLDFCFLVAMLLSDVVVNFVRKSMLIDVMRLDCHRIALDKLELSVKACKTKFLPKCS